MAVIYANELIVHECDRAISYVYESPFEESYQLCLLLYNLANLDIRGGGSYFNHWGCTHQNERGVGRVLGGATVQQSQLSGLAATPLRVRRNLTITQSTRSVPQEGKEEPTPSKERVRYRAYVKQRAMLATTPSKPSLPCITSIFQLSLVKKLYCSLN
ncbi:hypothetical protein J6590_011950 [Homalodisca vitripennis]|nr:hypothetical protein J6590_011950 [Homalodisca vitripennis]